MLADKLRSDLALSPDDTGVIVVDHGSRRAESNALLHDAADLFQRVSGMGIVEPAHMELAEPSIAQAFDRCVQRGASTVVVFPYFLSPGRHWSQDIPRLAAEAAAEHTGVRYQVTSPLGLHELLAEVMCERITHCLRRSLHGGEPCELCRPSGGCRMHEGP
ncbi:CbiX/SirB N-terminal domain-containing protein [Botrimarina sp.]|uniref:CbiX/SirB N-terminal domain-containing protein n=1 Tax=Botrimarina sp. TaxID=2795802 RepID=UPI0032ED95E8